MASAYLERQINKLPWWIRWPYNLVHLIVWVIFKIVGGTYRFLRRNRLKNKAIPTREVRKKLTTTIKSKIKDRDNGCCVLCGVGGRDAKCQVDHWIPVWAAPDLVAETWNLCLLCFDHNNAKSGKIPSHAFDWDQRKDLGPVIVYLPKPMVDECEKKGKIFDQNLAA